MLAGMVALVAVVFGALRPAYAWLLRRFSPNGEPSQMILAALLLGVFGCAAATEWLGLHAVFGAFLFGASLPRDDRLLRCLVERLEYLAIVLLMPIFFALAGLDTSADAFVGAGIGALLLVLLAAIAGKVLGGGIGARLAGYGWRESLATGVLMNARGLMELIVMKVGLDAGLIGSSLFTMLLVMAIVTTLMTSPMLSLFAGRSPGRVEPASSRV
jgi:Kef-type K+ transport system membrane component KefB